MCRLFGTINLSGQNKNIKPVFLNYSANAWNKGNTDGNFAYIRNRNEKSIVRTMSIQEYFTQVSSWDFSHSNLAIGHLRIATHGSASEKWIHGWEEKGWRLAHNGVFTSVGRGYINKFENDSYALLKLLLDKEAYTIKKIQKVMSKEVFGSGVVAFWNSENLFLISLNKTLYLNLLFFKDKSKALTFTSNNDIHHFKSRISVSDTTYYSVGDALFPSKEPVFSEKTEIKLVKDLTRELENVVVKIPIDNPQGLKILKLKKETYYGFTDYNRFRGLSQGYYEDY